MGSRSKPQARVWWIPIAVFVALTAAPVLGLGLEQMIGALIALHVLAALMGRPAVSIRLLVVILPFQLVITSALYAAGIGGPLVRMAGLWKELAALAVIMAGWSKASQHSHRLDALDRCALGFVALGTTYLAVPGLFVGDLGSSLSLDARFIAWRALVLPLLLLVAARHVRLSHEHLSSVFRTVGVVGTVVGALAIVEFVLPATWNRLMVDTLGVNRFRTQVLLVDPTELGGSIDDIRTYGVVGGRSIIRVGGTMASYLQLSFVLLIALAVLIERLVQGRRTQLAVAGVALGGAALLFTQTRSAIVGGCILVLAALRPAPGRSRHSRVRFMALAGLAGLVVVPMVFSAGLADRFTSGDVESDEVHEQRFDAAVEAIGDDPLGRGLGTGATGGQGVEGAIIPENQLLDVGVQLGVLGMVLVVATTWLLLTTLRRAATRTASGQAQLAVLGARGAVIALLVPAWYLQPIATPEVGWVLFLLAGAAVGAVDGETSARRSARAVARGAA